MEGIPLSSGVTVNTIHHSNNDGPITPEEWKLLKAITEQLRIMKAENPDMYQPKQILFEKLTEHTGSDRAKVILKNFRKGRKIALQYTPKYVQPFIISIPMGNNANPLSCLREDLLLNIFTEFLFTEDLAQLDTAVSSKGFRNHFQRCISRTDVTFDGSERDSLRCNFSTRLGDYNSRVIGDYVNWLIKRNIAVKSLCCSSTTVTSSILRILIKNMSHHRMGLSELSLINLNDLNHDHVMEYSDEDILFITENCSSLTTIHLGLSKFLTDISLFSIGTNYYNLQNFKLEIDQNSLMTEHGMISFSNLVSNLLTLKIDVISDGEIGQETIQDIAMNCSQLREISLQNRAIWGVALSSILTNCSHLTKLILKDADLDDEDIKMTLKYYSMEYLEINECYTESEEIPGSLVTDLFNAFPNLTSLKIVGSYPTLSENRINYLSPELKHLDYNGDCDDDTLIRLVKKCPNLSRIYLQSNKLTDIAIITMAEYCPFLSEFTLLTEENDKSITYDALDTLFNKCQYLKKLYIHSCDVSVSDYEDLITKYKSRQLIPVAF